MFGWFIENKRTENTIKTESILLDMIKQYINETKYYTQYEMHCANILENMINAYANDSIFMISFEDIIFEEFTNETKYNI